MKKLILPLLMLASVGAYAGDKGNGETIDVNSVPRLRDLVDNSVCRWVGGDEILEQNPLVNQIINRVSYLDWYFAAELRKEITNLDFCLTGELVKLDSRDEDSIVATYYYKTSQVGIRFNQMVYLNESITQRMPDYDRAFLIIHETMHSYLNYKEPMRNHKLKSMVRALESVYTGSLRTTEKLHLQMRNNEIRFPLTVGALDIHRAAVEFIFKDYDEKRAVILGSDSVENIFEAVKLVPAVQLATWHLKMLEDASFESFLNQAIAREDLGIIEKLLKDSVKLKSYALSTLYTNQIAQNSVVLRNYLDSQSTIQEFLGSLVRDIVDARLSLSEDGRLVIEGISLLGDSSSEDSVPFTSLTPMSKFELNKVNALTNAYFTLISSLLKRDNMEVLGQATFANPDFYKAFNNKDLKKKISAMEIPSELEKSVALRKVDTLLTGFWEVAKASVVKQSSEKKWKEFVKKIDQSKLGYEIK